MIKRLIKILLLVAAILLPSLIFYDKLEDKIKYLEAWGRVKKLRADKHEYEIRKIEKKIGVKWED